MKKLNIVLGIQNEIKAHQLENEFLIMDLNHFSSIEYIFSKSKTLRLLIKGCKVKKEDGSIFYSIVAKLGLSYSVFVSTFHSTRESIISQGTLLAKKQVSQERPRFRGWCQQGNPL